MIDTWYKNFKEEAELFFVTKFLSGNAIDTMYKKCLDIIFNITGEIDSTKGLIAFNKKYGQGKSFFFKVVHHRYLRTQNKQAFKKTSADELCKIFVEAKKTEDPFKKLDEFINVRNLYIEDIGTELKDGKERINYGNKCNVLRYVLFERFKMWETKGWKLYGDTNLTIDQIGSNYDGRLSDRILQMCYWETFDFLENGTSFRQVRSTRPLTQAEIKKNWLKFVKPKEEVKLDKEKYFNELINESDDYFENKDASFWTFTREYLIEKGLLNESDFDKIDVQMMESSELILQKDLKTQKRNEFKHSTAAVRYSAIENAIGSINKNKIYNVAENIIARRKFMELRKNKHVFT